MKSFSLKSRLQRIKNFKIENFKISENSDFRTLRTRHQIKQLEHVQIMILSQCAFRVCQSPSCVNDKVKGSFPSFIVRFRVSNIQRMCRTLFLVISCRSVLSYKSQ